MVALKGIIHLLHQIPDDSTRGEKLFHKLFFVLQLLCDIGLQGVYFLKNGVCRHYSFAIDNICDVITQ